MPRPRVNEKSKDFFGSMKRLLFNLSPWKYIMILGLCLAMIGSILALVSPNKLSDFADTISSGIKPNTDKLEEVNKNIFAFIEKKDFEEKIIKINDSQEISVEDKEMFGRILNQIQNDNSDESKMMLYLIPDSILNILLEDFKIDGVLISKEDQLDMIHLTKEMDYDDKEKMIESLDNLPESINDLVSSKIDMNKIKKIAIFLIILQICSALFEYVQAYSMTTVSNNFAKSLRTKISKKINKLPLKYFDTHENGDVLSRITNDVDTIAQNLNNSLATLVSSTTLFIGSILMMFITNWIMAITAIAASIIGFSLMFLILGKSQKYFNENQRALGELNGYIEENYAGHTVVKVYNGEKDAKEEFERLNNNLYEAKRKSIFLSGMMQPIMMFIGNFGYVAVCIVGALLTMNNVITFGVIVAFMIYVRLFTNPLSQIAQAMTNLQSTAAASERVFEFLEEEEMPIQDNIKKYLDPSLIKGEISFKHVKFGYDENKTIIKDFSVDVHPGQKVAIVGPTGAGKTTMVNLLMKFYDIKDGDILIDGISTKELTRENIHDLFVMVLQDTWLFEGTIKENIRFNKKDVADEEIWDACKVVGIHHFIKTLPKGLDAELKENDVISSGQKQLLTIARGMIENAPFLILDEATSNVDTRTEEIVSKAMDKLTEGKTSFIIAHRLSTIKNADLILVMDEGNIVEQGTHEQLMKKKGFYAELYNSQFLKID